jgi:hypothetical protein
MTPRIEQLTEEDKKTISKNRAKDSVGIIFTVVFFTAMLAFLYYDTHEKIDFNTQIITDSWTSILITGIGLLILGATIFKIRNAATDMQEGKKEIFTGAITKKRDGKNNSKYYFVIDNEEFRISKKIYNQFEEGNILSIERSPKAHYFLNVYQANITQGK